MSLLPIRIVEKPWGRVDLPPPFINPGQQPVGEIWFEPPSALATLLVKYIFTSENLSVQCHPSDRQALELGLGRQGKEECWLVLDAEPGAQLAIGFDDAVDIPTMRSAAIDGSIEDLLTWHSVAPGDFFYIPANTVHAIGAGVTLIEVQQNSDITYRLYDYGRPRDLHLDQGMAIACGKPYPPGMHRRLSLKKSAALVQGPYFQLDWIYGVPARAHRICNSGPLLVIPVDAPLGVNDIVVDPGQCALAASLDDISFSTTGGCLIAQPLAASCPA